VYRHGARQAEDSHPRAVAAAGQCERRDRAAVVCTDLDDTSSTITTISTGPSAENPHGGLQNSFAHSDAIVRR